MIETHEHKGDFKECRESRTAAPSLRRKYEPCRMPVFHRTHESTDRLFAWSTVKLPPMTEVELSDIVRNAENDIDGAITFDEAATRRLVSLAQVIHI